MKLTEFFRAELDREVERSRGKRRVGTNAQGGDPGHDQSLVTSPRSNDCLPALDGREGPGTLWPISRRSEFLNSAGN
jgi:hypothetical protein